MELLSWFDLESRFRSLEGRDKHGLRANWRSIPWNDKGDHWYLSGSTGAHQVTKFQWLAEHAALKLKHSDPSTALSYWLDLLRQHSPNFRRRGTMATRLRGGKTKFSSTGLISRVCEASADYCLKLANEQAREGMREESANRDEAASPRRKTTRTSILRSKSPYERKRERIIFGALQANLKGPKYCAHIDGHKLLASEKWSSEGDWPGSYAQAYRVSEKWRKRIQDEKWRFRQKYNKLTPSEREKIIDDSHSRTRPTRQ